MPFSTFLQEFQWFQWQDQELLSIFLSSHSAPQTKGLQVSQGESRAGKNLRPASIARSQDWPKSLSETHLKLHAIFSWEPALETLNSQGAAEEEEVKKKHCNFRQ